MHRADCKPIARGSDELVTPQSNPRIDDPAAHALERHPVALDIAKYRGVDAEKRARLREAWNRPNYLPAYALVAFLVVGAMFVISGIFWLIGARYLAQDTVLAPTRLKLG